VANPINRSFRGITPAVLPVAPAQYDAATANRANQALRLFMTEVSNFAFTPISFAKYVDNTTQTNPVGDVVRVISFNSTPHENALRRAVPGGIIYISDPGMYYVMGSVQFSKTAGGDSSIFWWFRRNQADLLDSATTYSVTSSTGTLPCTKVDLLSLSAGDTLELCWSSADTNVSIVPTSSGAANPAGPSAMLTLAKISNALVT
jgi:hypothetical protein